MGGGWGPTLTRLGTAHNAIERDWVGNASLLTPYFTRHRFGGNVHMGLQKLRELPPPPSSQPLRVDVNPFRA